MKTFKGKGVTDGKNAGPALVTAQMFGFWGGVDPATGIIIDQRHELCGQSIKGKVFVFPEGEGQSYLKSHGHPAQLAGFAYKTELLLGASASQTAAGHAPAASRRDAVTARTSVG